MDSSNYPVDFLTWEDAVEFCKQLSDRPAEQNLGRSYRLPTEVEWEYACRAGSETAYWFGGNLKLLGNYAWCYRNSNRQTHPVGTKKPNAWGIYDMHGNVREYCEDWYGEYPKGQVTDPVNPQESLYRIICGGGWNSAEEFERSAYRSRSNPRYFRSDETAFRVVLISSGICK
jgi:formylglycine-generating enzyme required for sulfatase activity